ncbi:hypothetical protein DFS34DRAFT_590279 [Phlyctochytrium arcticum]|nr:hypothetical protein DFS34DRAFT_590279 [Phlyctochytrium arcticum]
MALFPKSNAPVDARMCLPTSFKEIYPEEEVIPCDVCRKDAAQNRITNAEIAIQDIIDIIDFLARDEDFEGDATAAIIAKIYGWHTNTKIPELPQSTADIARERFGNRGGTSGRGRRKLNVQQVKELISKMVLFRVLAQNIKNTEKSYVALLAVISTAIPTQIPSLLFDTLYK